MVFYVQMNCPNKSDEAAEQACRLASGRGAVLAPHARPPCAVRFRSFAVPRSCQFNSSVRAPISYPCTYVMMCGGGCPYIFALLCKIIVLHKSAIRLLCSFAGAAPSGPAAGKIARQKRGPTGVRPRRRKRVLLLKRAAAPCSRPCPSALRCAVSLICRAALMPVQLISPRLLSRILAHML